jgi:hypothetical protein
VAIFVFQKNRHRVATRSSFIPLKNSSKMHQGAGFAAGLRAGRSGAESGAFSGFLVSAVGCRRFDYFHSRHEHPKGQHHEPRLEIGAAGIWHTFSAVAGMGCRIMRRPWQAVNISRTNCAAGAGMAYDERTKLEALRDHFDVFSKGANYLMVGHAAGFAGCLSVVREHWIFRRLFIRLGFWFCFLAPGFCWVRCSGQFR